MPEPPPSVIDPPVDHALEEQLEELSTLAEPARRTLYLYVAPSPEAVSRDEAATATGMSRALVAFHLDRLVADGFLETEYRRRSGRTGPGAGRPAKLYRRARSRSISVSLPRRNMELAAGLFADALDDPTGANPIERLATAASAYGRNLGEHAGAAAPGVATVAKDSVALERVLADAGFEPRLDESGAVRLGNCPFHGLVSRHRNLTCGMNLALMQGVLDGLASEQFTARIDERPGLCCVAFEPSPSAAEPAPAEPTVPTGATPPHAIP